MLEVRDLRVAYGNIEALHGISLTVAEGEIVTLIGANGAGKSTTLRAVSGLVRARSGQILFEGHDITRIPAHRIVALGIGHVPEGRKIFTDMTVQENLELGAYIADPRRFREDLEAVFERFPRLRERRRQSAATLSGGEQQMLALGRALMLRPRLLLLDEPSMGLSPRLVEEIFAIIVALNRAGTTVLLVEQNAAMALSIAHRAYVLETGRVVLEGPAKELRNHPAVKEAYLGGGGSVQR
ncbi:ABC transporter ATP-binding protein [Symbiobacterium thermophilum]|uniref:Branched chain amino acid ABC transporter ATP-binding protein n=1 Tax=Symbiobacterium thermophilum (strain DSM 24528 / JCM 14929 / IAM 14863 / T) TaxID=292459 RepID=Q67NZ0_SYMTH|nr:ABC transporter ATP-binding protein [Symbiobacterium thermophilum]BAD40603.1 branched chain amino acid ABC transporter ATP-binding protein [Symbiobacterium thermophilum IAM 14863]